MDIPNDMSVADMFLSVVPMSWRRAVRRYVSSNEGVDQEGKAWASIALPVDIHI